MYVKTIRWLNMAGKEAEVEVSDTDHSLLCFSQPCTYVINQEIYEPLECLSARNIMLADIKAYNVIKGDGPYDYMICGKLINRSGVVQLGTSIMLHIESDQIPKDIAVNSYIVFSVDRIDLW